MTDSKKLNDIFNKLSKKNQLALLKNGFEKLIEQENTEKEKEERKKDDRKEEKR